LTKIHRHTSGFTLIELLVVVAIIGVLASSVLTSVQKVRERANDTQKISSLKNIATALEVYRLNYGQYPDTGGLSTTYAGTDCALMTDVKAVEWIPGLVTNKYISMLPPNQASDPTSCFIYASNGQYFVLSWWDSSIDGGQRLTVAQNPLYSLAGFRESGFDQNCLYDHPNLNGSWAYGGYNFYIDSFTITNLPSTTDVSCVAP
jgi:type II secretion system protein G